MALFVERAADGEDLLCSQLAVLEVRSAIRRKLLFRETSAALAFQALTLLQEEMRRWTLTPIDTAVLDHASTCIDQHALRALDAIQLGTALLLNSPGSSHPTTFIAYDKRLIEAAKASGLPTMSPEEAD